MEREGICLAKLPPAMGNSSPPSSPPPPPPAPMLLKITPVVALPSGKGGGSLAEQPWPEFPKGLENRNLVCVCVCMRAHVHMCCSVSPSSDRRKPSIQPTTFRLPSYKH